MINQDLTIDSLATLTITDTLSVGNSSKIIVQPGAKLVVDGGTLTSACTGEMWQGIEVLGDPTKRQLPQYQGTVELLNGAIIENAHCAIHTGYQGDGTYATTGGIIKADSAFFINNRRSIAFLSYTNHTPMGAVTDNQSYFKRCEFTVDNNNLFSQNNSSFIDHVTMWEVRGVVFKGCTFNNLTSDALAARRHAIYAEDAGFILETYCRSAQSIPQGCECPENVSRFNTFSGFNTAVEANTAESQHAVNINHALFGNNNIAVRINGNNFVTVTRCQFELSSAPSSSTLITGLSLQTCTGYKVEGNSFTRESVQSHATSIGVKVTKSGKAYNTLYHNTFKRMTIGIHVNDTNGGSRTGLEFSCNEFINCTYGLYAESGSLMAPTQGSISKGVDNIFTNTLTSSLNNNGDILTCYYHSSNINFTLYHPSGVLTESNFATLNPCTPTFCNGGGIQPLLTDFQSSMEAYATGDANTDGMDEMPLHKSLSETYYDAVRALLADSILDINALEQWHTAAQPIADPYSLTETRFMMGYSEPFVADAVDAELANYAEFHAMKLALRGQYDNTDNQDNNINLSNSQNSPTINWYALTPAQIAQLQTIAERNTGRASVMAKGVLCFFFGICYDDDLLVDDNQDNQGNQGDAETRSAKAVQQDGKTNLNVYPNPTDDVLYVELSGAGIQSAGLYDLQGRIVADAANAGGHPAVTFNVRNVPAGVYVLRVTDENGKEYHQKVVVK